MKYLKAAFLFLFPLINYTVGMAQICEGSLGDPVVNITFGAGSAFTLPLDANATTYRYFSGLCPDDGFYNIASQSLGCFGGSWHNVVQDHTPNDTNGNMMLVNASLQPGDFYTQKVTGLCGGTTYEFAAFILNILKNNACNLIGIDPIITFTIENLGGEIIKTYTTGNIAETENPEWKQFGFFFTTPLDAEEVIIRIRNNSSGGCGNDLALDDITFRACGPTVIADFSNLPLNSKLCEGERGTIFLNGGISSGYINPSYQWQINNNDGEGWKDIVAANQKSYTLEIPIVDKDGYQFRLAVAEGSNINSPNCLIFSDIILVEISKQPIADAGNDIVLIEGNSVTLQGKAEGSNLSYFWTPASYLDNANVLNPVANPPENITYTLNVLSTDGCNSSASDQVYLRVLKNLVIPNTFTPNGDLKNDYWKIAALNTYPEAEIQVFNRYGKIVFKSVGYDQEWDGNFDGRPLPVGVYYYMINLKTGNQILKGSVLIIR